MRIVYLIISNRLDLSKFDCGTKKGGGSDWVPAVSKNEKEKGRT